MGYGGAAPAEFTPETFDDLPGWADDDHLAAFAAFRRSALQAEIKPYRSGSLGIRAEAFRPAFEAARAANNATAAEARDFFERCFRPLLVRPAGTTTGFVTGFYEPEAAASRTRSDEYRFPIYARPPDLIDIDGHNRPPGMDSACRFGRMTGGKPVPYFDRRQIENGALAGQCLEIVWLADRVDLFFIHVQGAARLVLPDGSVMRITYAAKSGHPFTGIGRVLADLGEIPPEQVTMQTIRAWLAANPARVDEILWQNRSFIFFREHPVDDEGLGPVAAAKVQLTPGRSMAVDRLLHTFATPFFVAAPTLHAFRTGGFRRLMIAQDTGSAIIGPARGDLFTGSGPEAGRIAGVIRHDADFHVLVPAKLAEVWM